MHAGEGGETGASGKRDELERNGGRELCREQERLGGRSWVAEEGAAGIREEETAGSGREEVCGGRGGEL